MRRFKVARFVSIAAAALALACGGNSGSASSPTSPTPPVITNHNPLVSNVNVSPTWGIASLTPFAFSASASDPDGDPLTFTWNLGGGTSSTGQNTNNWVWGCPGFSSGTVQVTVTDGRGGSTTATSPPFSVGCMSGTWVGTDPKLAGWTFTLALTQSSSGVVTGTYTDSFGGTGRSDPAQPGWIHSDGRMELRNKISFGSFSDFTFDGQMDQSGRTVNGTITGSGFNDPFTMNKQ